MARLFFFNFLLLIGCTSTDQQTVNAALPVVITTGVSSVSSGSAVCTGTITSGGASAIISKGVCWSTSTNPLISGNYVEDTTGGLSVTGACTGLLPGTVYYARAYAINSAGVGYGEAVQFTTLANVCGNISDIDGNSYATVTIGSKCWTKQNLNVSHYRNGDAIPQVQDAAQWATLTTGAWCYYENQTANGTIYGKLYNWYAVSDPRGLAPQGWHVSSKEDWQTFGTYLGVQNLGGKLKAMSTWNSPNTGADNSSGFTALAGGRRWYSDGSFSTLGNYGNWWTSTDGPSPFAQMYLLGFSDDFLSNEYRDKTNGYSVRCVKD